MSAASKAKGTLYERELSEFIGQFFETQRLPRTGAKDEGDVEVRVTSDIRLVIEAKNHKALSFSDWLRQAEVEADHREAKVGNVACVPVVMAKRRGKNTSKSYVVMEADEFILMLKMLLGRHE